MDTGNTSIIDATFLQCKPHAAWTDELEAGPFASSHARSDGFEQLTRHARACSARRNTRLRATRPEFYPEALETSSFCLCAASRDQQDKSSCSGKQFKTQLSLCKNSYKYSGRHIKTCVSCNQVCKMRSLQCKLRASLIWG